MRKKVITRVFFGASLGLTICTFISIVISLIYGDGNYFPISYELIEDCGTEINAVILQTVLALIYGSVWGGASVIWEIENWSLLKMTFVHLIICSGVSFPVAYFLRWMPRSIAGGFLFFGIFFIIYTVIWFYKYSYIKKQIKSINDKLKNNN